MSEILHRRDYTRRLQAGFEVKEKFASDVIGVIGLNAEVNGAKMHVVEKQVFLAPGSPLEMTDVNSLTGFEESMRAGFNRISNGDQRFFGYDDKKRHSGSNVVTITPTLEIASSSSMGGSGVGVYMYPDAAMASFMAEVARQDSVYVTSQFEHLQKRISQKDIDEAKSGELHRQLQEAILTDKRRGL